MYRSVDHAADLNWKPSGTRPVFAYRQSAMINFRASATIIGLRDP
jgi:hypothetical protein